MWHPLDGHPLLVCRLSSVVGEKRNNARDYGLKRGTKTASTYTSTSDQGSQPKKRIVGNDRHKQTDRSFARGEGRRVRAFAYNHSAERKRGGRDLAGYLRM
jgi:hypothetical protein